MWKNIQGIARVFYLGLLVFFPMVCQAGGFGGGFFGPLDTIKISIQATNTTLPANLTNVPPSLILPFTTSVIVRVERIDGSVIANGTQVQLAVDGVRHGAITKLDDPQTQDINEFLQLMGTVPAETASGQAQFFFTSLSEPGTATLTASALDPVSGRTIAKSLQITVTRVDRPVASLTFTGPYVDAVLSNVSSFGNVPLQNGTYSRVISVVATDASGNPVNPGTPIYFSLIDAPLLGYPNEGAGSFLIAGSNGDPLEGGFNFFANGGNFLTKGARAFDRLILDGTQMVLPDNRFLTGSKIIEALLSQNSLRTHTLGNPFNIGINNGATVPYVIGRAQQATILSTGYTDTTGTASTLLTYPVSRLGQTAILVAHTADGSVSTVLNTCDVEGNNCSPVFLGVSDGTDRILTTSTTTLGANSASDVKLCLKDANLAPLPAAEIIYAVGSPGSATVTINDNAANLGSLFTMADGCVTATVASSSQIAGSEPITLTFTSEGVTAPVEITVNSPNAGNLIGTIDGTTVNLQLIDDNGTPISDTFISHNYEATDKDNSCTTEGSENSNKLAGADVSYDPVSQLTDTEGRLTAFVTLSGDSGDAVTITFETLGGATYKVTFSNLEEAPNCPAPESES